MTVSTGGDPDRLGSPGAGSAAEAEDGTRNLGGKRTKQEVEARRIQRRRALLIGVCEYESAETFTTLRYPVKDVRLMRELLIGYGYYNVEWLDDTVGEAHLRPTRENILRALDRVCEELQPDDLLWIHFSGHGLRWARPSGEDARLLAVQDTRASDPLNTAIDIDRELLPKLRSCKARQKVVTLDACHLGYSGTKAAGDAKDLLAYDAAEGMAVLTASSSKQYAHESNTVGSGVFTNYLVQVVRDLVNQRQIAALAQTANGVLAEVTNWYKKNDRFQQQPTVSYEGIGEILLVDMRPTQKPAPTPTPGPESAGQPNDLLLQIPDIQLTGELEPPTLCSKNYLAARHIEGSGERPTVVVTLLDRGFVTEPRYERLRSDFALRLAAFEKLKHDGFARFIERGVVADAKRTYFVTEFLPGSRLSLALATLRLSYPDLLGRMVGLAEAMAAAHQSGLVHGSLDLDKVVSTNHGFQIVDLPVMAIDVQIRLTERQNEPRSKYFAPELHKGAPVPTVFCDVYALGCLMDEFLDLSAPDEDGKLRRFADKSLLRLIEKMRQQQPRQRPSMDRVAMELRALLPNSTQQAALRRLRGTWLAMGGGIAAAVTLGYGIYKYAPMLGGTTDPGRAAKRGDLGVPIAGVNASPVQQAREVLHTALVDSTNTNLPGEAARSIGWLRDPTFGGNLGAILVKRDSFKSARRVAAWALGRIGGLDAISDLRDVIKDENADLELWQEALRSLCSLSSPDAVLDQEIGRALLTESRVKERRMIALGLFAPTDQKSRAALAGMAKSALAEASTPQAALKQADLLLALARMPDKRARTAMAKLLQFEGTPSVWQIRLALLWVAAGDPTGLPLLERVVKEHEPQGELTHLVLEARRLVSRHAPSAPQCKSAAEVLTHPPGEQASNAVRWAFHARLWTLPLCPQPATYVESLRTFLSPGNPNTESDPLLRIYAAANLLEIQRTLQTVPPRPSPNQPGETALTTRELVARDIESSGLSTLRMAHLRTAANPNASPTLRRLAARQARAERAMMEQRQGDPVIAEHLGKPEVVANEQRLVEMQKSGRPVDKAVAVLAQHDDKVVASWLAQASMQATEVQFALAERLQTPQSTEVLRTALGQGSFESLRAFGELRRRGVDVQVPKRDLLSEYSRGGAEDRLELVDAMSGWPFATARPLLLLATNDGSVDVRRSAVRILGEAAAVPDSEAEALSILRLMFGDSDYIVHLYLRAILAGRRLSASEINPAPAWPPDEVSMTGCEFPVTGDDKGASFQFAPPNGPVQTAKLPFSVTLQAGQAKLLYLDERGNDRQRTVTCIGNKGSSISLPISSVGQDLALGVQQWNKHKVEPAFAIFTQVNARANAARLRDPDAQQRMRVILARSEYYLGKALLEKKNLPDAAEHFSKYLALPAADTQEDLTPDAKQQMERLKSQLGRYFVRLIVDGKCQEFTAWDRAGSVDVDVKIGQGRKRMFPNKVLRKGTITEGDHECKK